MPSCPSSWRIALLAAAALAAPNALATSVSIDVRARELAPGEPVRIEISSPEPLERVTAHFLDRRVFMARRPGGGEREIWSGWSLIPLDAESTLTAVEVSGVSLAGDAVIGTRSVRIREKEFPVEELSVAPRYVEPPPEVKERLARERAKLSAIYETRLPGPPASGPFLRPVAGERTSIFGTRRVFNGKPRSPHSGLDLRASTGTEVKASGPGRVVLAQDLYYSGNTVIVDHGGGLFTLYAHLSEILVAEGDEARPGDLLGRSGATGRVTGPHLHWGAKIGDLPFDPTALLDAALFP